MKNWKQNAVIGNPQPNRKAVKVPLLMVAIIAFGFAFVACGYATVSATEFA
jgi:hypothetical protein